MTTGNSREEMAWTAFDGGLRLNATHSDRSWKLVHTQYAFCALTQGAADWQYRRRSFTIQPGKVYVCEPGEVHATVRTYGPGDYTVLFLDLEWLTGLSEELAGVRAPHFPAEGITSPQLWQQMVAIASASGSSKEELTQRASVTLASAVAGRDIGQRTALRAPVLEKAKNQLRQRFASNPQQTIRIDEVARDLQLGYHTLVHDFSRHFGAAPYEYVAMLRRQYVLQLLRHGPCEQLGSMTAISRQAGYSDASHMSRDLRKHFGHPPQELATQLHAGWRKRR